MAHRAVADIRDDFHVGVSVRRKTAVRRDLVIVPDAQRPPAGPRMRRREMMPGLEPIAPITRKRMKGPTFDHDSAPRVSSSKFAPMIRYKIETFETFGFRKWTSPHKDA